jgi:hypothetical protein
MQATRGLVGLELVNRGAIAPDRVVHQEQVQGKPAAIAVAVALVLCTAALPLWPKAQGPAPALGWPRAWC